VIAFGVFSAVSRNSA